MKLKLLSLLLSAGLLTGCASDGNVSNKRYLRAVSVGRDTVTLSFFPDGSDNVTVCADSPAQARRSAELGGGRKIFTGYTELVILDGCENPEVLEFMLHEWKVSPSCMIACPEGSGDELLTGRSAEELEGAVKLAQEQELVGRCDIVTVLGALLTGDRRAEVPELSEHGFSGTIVIE
ncbi:MAG: hypothetical protein IKP42_03890 [Ruminococcus sp.]|nr:hypothetical protein [Ruminococcus sp.]